MGRISIIKSAFNNTTEFEYKSKFVNAVYENIPFIIYNICKSIFSITGILLCIVSQFATQILLHESETFSC